MQIADFVNHIRTPLVFEAFRAKGQGRAGTSSGAATAVAVEPAPAATPPATGAFITPQSLVTFPIATALVTGLWKGAQALNPAFASPWVALLLAFAIGGVIAAISFSDDRLYLSRREMFIAIGVAIINSGYLFAIAVGAMSAVN